MKLHEHPLRHLNLIARHGAGEIAVRGQLLRGPCIVTPTTLVAEWIPGPDGLDLASLAPLWALEPRIVLLGVAPQPAGRWRELRQQLAGRGIALDVMDVGAACRTYNVLAQEDRAVAALLFP